jgi:hypothetical protein
MAGFYIFHTYLAHLLVLHVRAPNLHWLWLLLQEKIILKLGPALLSSKPVFVGYDENNQI